MKSRLPFDELNVLKARMTRHFGADGRIKSQDDCEDIIDELLDLYLLALASAVDAVNEQFNARIEPTPQEVQDMIYRRIGGATWVDRVLTWYMTGGTAEDIMRIAETEMHRIGVEAADFAAVKAGATTKKWVCMMLPTSRDTHVWLNGTTVPIDGYFYSHDGGKTLYPGQWGIAEEDVNCLCELEYS